MLYFEWSNIMMVIINNTFEAFYICCWIIFMQRQYHKYFIKEEIRIYGLDKNIKIFNFLLDEEVIYLYLKASAIIIPTYVARSTLPLYESFYFKKTIFYSQEVLDKKLEDLVIPVDLKNPKDLAEKLEYFIHNKNHETNSKRIINARNYFNLYCNEKNISDKIYKIFEEYKYLRKRWVKN